MLTFGYRDALRVVFDHVSLQIENLISDQIAQVTEKGLAVKVDLILPRGEMIKTDLLLVHLTGWRFRREPIPLRPPCQMPFQRWNTRHAGQRSVRVP